MAIIKNFVKVLFPFQYDKDAEIHLEEVEISTKKGNPYKLFQRVGFENAELRKGLSELFSKENNKSGIMRGYRLDKNIREQFGLPPKEMETVKFFCRAKERKEPYAVEISGVTLYLFESGVGFAEAELRHQSNDLADVISCNYFLSEIGDKKNYFVVSQRVWQEEKKCAEFQEKQFTLAELLGKLLEYIPGVTDFYSGLSWDRVYKKGLVYSYLYLEEKPEAFEELLFNLRLNYKESYKVPKKYASIQDDPAVLQQFENSYWVSSYNGATNVSIKTEDSVTDCFFADDFYVKMQREYYVLFLAALHQKYTILKLMWEMGELDRLDLDYKVMKEQLLEARKYQAEAANLKFRDFFKFPSYVQHVNDYYDLLYRTLCIDELYQNLSQDLDNIEEICKVYVEKIKRHEALKRKLRKAVVKVVTSLLATVIGLVTLLNESWSLLEKTYGTPSGTFSVPVILVTAVLAVPSVVGVMEAIGNVRELRRERKESEVETGHK